MRVQRNILVEQEVWSQLKLEGMKKDRNVRELAADILSDYAKKYKKLERPENLKAIIIAAGPGSRLGTLTSEKPKCMLRIGGKTILQKAIETFRACGIKNIVVIRGYKKEAISYPGLRYCHNEDYENNNILESLMCAEGEMDAPFIVAYSDIVFDRGVVEALIKSKADMSVVVDTDWLSNYRDRFQHPVEEAENIVIKGGKVVKIAKTISPVEAHGEFIGMAKFSLSGVNILKSVYKKARKNFLEKPFHTAVNIRKAYLTDMFQELINRGYPVAPVLIQGGWKEIDTQEDFQRVAGKN